MNILEPDWHLDDYDAFAVMLRNSKRPQSRETDASIRELAHRLASIFELDNPRFDRERFINKACD